MLFQVSIDSSRFLKHYGIVFLQAKIPTTVRGAALDSLVILVAQGIITREETIAYFKSLFSGKLERYRSEVWYSLVQCCQDIYPEEVIEDIKLAFKDNLIEFVFIDAEDLQKMPNQDKQTVMEELSNSYECQFIEDTIIELKNWACFSNQNSLSLYQSSLSKLASAANEKKIGRNDPCPCGSGKKYKKCCGN